jgi:hypothetical protein
LGLSTWASDANSVNKFATRQDLQDRLDFFLEHFYDKNAQTPSRILREKEVSFTKVI